MNSWLADVMGVSTVFDIAIQKAKISSKQFEVGKVRKKEQSVERSEDEKILSINFEAEDTIEYFLKVVPEHVYSDKLFDDIEKLKVRYIPSDRKVKIFSGLFEEQRLNIEQRKSKLITKTNNIPDQLPFNAQFDILNGNRSQKFTLQRQDLAKLNPEIDLNDTILDSYIKILKLFVIPEDVLKKTYFFSTFFMGQLMCDIVWKEEGQTGKDYEKRSYEEMREKVERNHQKLMRWLRKIDIFQMDYLVVPINSNNHWNCLLIIHPNSLLQQKKHCRIIGLDSMFQIKPILYDIFKVFLSLEMTNKHNIHIDTLSIPTCQLLVLRQTNYHDCGLYVLSYIETTFTNQHILTQITQNIRKNYLSLFPRQLINSMRVQLKNLLYTLTKIKTNSQKVEKVRQFLNQRKIIIKNENLLYEYEIIDKEYFNKYCLLSPSYSQSNEDEDYKLLLRFYLDGEINYYEKDNSKDLISF